VSILSVDNRIFVKCLNIITCWCILEIVVACYLLSSVAAVGNSFFIVPVILK
jgi:hypothetical protein